jgi:hypothetical protein
MCKWTQRCATRRHITEREEGTRRRPVAADRRSWRQLDPRDGGLSGSSLDNDETGQHCQMARARQARRDGVSRSEPVVEPPQANTPAQTWWIWVGQPCVPPHSAEAATLEPSSCGGAEAIGKELRRTRSDAAGEKLDPTPVNRCVVNVGTAVKSPSRRLEAPAKGRSVVV